MLALTPTAAEVVDSIVSQQELPATAGLRIPRAAGDAASAGAESQRARRLSVGEQPEAGDALVQGTQVYVEPGETAELLEDKVLDAEIEGNEVRFSIAQQAEPDAG